jgi:hypothetical protein
MVPQYQDAANGDFVTVVAACFSRLATGS